MRLYSSLRCHYANTEHQSFKLPLTAMHVVQSRVCLKVMTYSCLLSNTWQWVSQPLCHVQTSMFVCTQLNLYKTMDAIRHGHPASCFLLQCVCSCDVAVVRSLQSVTMSCPFSRSVDTVTTFVTTVDMLI